MVTESRPETWLEEEICRRINKASGMNKEDDAAEGWVLSNTMIQLGKQTQIEQHDRFGPAEEETQCSTLQPSGHARQTV